MGKKLNLEGKRFGRLQVIGDDGQRRHSQVLWLCLCDCGNYHRTVTASLRSAAARSCGCLHKEQATLNLHGGPTQGDSAHPLYSTWSGMLARCYNPNATGYKNYGGRGIRVCERWANDFDSFCEDMGAPPSQGLSIDRINNNGDYTPDNCRWADRTTQSRNRRYTRITRRQAAEIKYLAAQPGVIQAAVARLYGVKPHIVADIHCRRNWKDVKPATIPIDRRLYYGPRTW